jgi:predicted small lipoprotein YifL
MKPAARERAAALAILFGALAACGQRGPLTLPDSARPIEALPSGPAAPPGDPDTVPQSGVTPAPGVGTTPPAQREPGSDDEPSDEQSDRDEPERVDER